MYREDPALRMPLADIGISASGNIPILVPEIVLLYKAHERTEKGEADFRVALHHLSPRSRSWLLRALKESAPHHACITHLRMRVDFTKSLQALSFRESAGSLVSGTTPSRQLGE